MKGDHELAVEVLHIVLDNIAYENRDENGIIITSYQIYPLENSHSQIMKRQVYKNHLLGLLFKLKLIKTRKSRGTTDVIVSVVNDAMKWNSYLKDSTPYTFCLKLYTEGGRSVFLSIPDSTLDSRPKLEQTHLQFLQKCRKEFINAIPNYQQYLSKDEDTDSETDATDTTETETSSESEPNEAERKRPADTDLTAPRRLKTHRIEGGSVMVEAPYYCKVTTKNQYSKMEKELSEVKRALEEKCAEFETLQLKNEQYQEANELLTSECNSLKDRCVSNLKDVDQKNNQIKTFQAQLDKEKQLVRELKETIQSQKEKVRIADIVLTLPQQASRWHPSLQGRKFYSMAFSIIPGASAKYLQMFIPLVICAFLSDVGLSDLFPTLKWVTDLTPSDKSLDLNVMIHAESMNYNICNMILTDGTKVHWAHDKGERQGLGRHVEAPSLNNRGKKLDPDYPDAIISLRVNADGSNPKDKHVADKIINTIEHIEHYIPEEEKNEKEVRMSSVNTDHGGGGGTMESSAKELKAKREFILALIHWINNCMLHGHSLPLELAWIEYFGDFGIGKHSVSQLLYDLWYIQDKLGEYFKPYWKVIMKKEYKGKLLPKCILTRWGYSLNNCSMVDADFDDYFQFLSHLVEAVAHGTAVGMATVEAWKIIQAPEIRPMIKFIAIFGKYYWTAAFRWLRRKDETTRLEGFQSHEALIFIFIQYQKLSKLTKKKWIDRDEFKEVKTLLNQIENEETKDSVSRRFSDFLDQYQNEILTPTAWGHYITDNVLMAFGTTNNKARQLVAQWVVSQVNDEPWDPVANEQSEKTETHDEFSYLDLQKFLQEKCELDTQHPFINKHFDAIQYLARTGEDIYQDNVSVELKEFKNEVEESILPARSHNQAVEQGVQLISHCLGNGRSEHVATAMFSIVSNEHQKVTYLHNEALKTKEIRPNQHRSGGTNDSGNRVAISEEAKRLEEERNELGQEYITKSQASKEKAKCFIDLCEKESYANIPEEAMKKIDKRARDKKTNKELTTKEIRIRQKIDELTASIERNEHLKVANGRAKPRRKENIKPATIEKPVNQTGLFKVTNFQRKVQMKYIVEEIVCLCIEKGSLVSDNEIKAERERLKKIKKVMDLKVELRAALGVEDPEDGKQDKDTKFKVQSELTNSIGGAAKLRGWKDANEKALNNRRN